MSYPIERPRRLRMKENIRKLVCETILSSGQLVMPYFVAEGIKGKAEIQAMPDQFRYSEDALLRELDIAARAGVQHILLFGIPRTKDNKASSAFSKKGVVQSAVRKIKKHFPGLTVITDVCLCEYMIHGHCGVIRGEHIVNDATLPILAKTALSHAEAGADMVAPSDMMDGRVSVIRKVLDEKGFHDTPIISYAAKFASAFYGPFREAAFSRPSFGDRKSYQMDCANLKEALREMRLDIEEGADIVMVKPALPYLDIISSASREFHVPIAAYQVSGEYSMIKSAANRGTMDEMQLALETLTSIKRAGAQVIITYFAKQIISQLKKG